jgi:hypothetical protein
VATGPPITLDESKPETFARVTFAAPLDTYDAALVTVIDLGLWIGDVCPFASSGGCRVQRESFGQEQSFAASHTHVVDTTPFATSDQWQQQLQATAGVRRIETPYTPKCP